MLKEITDLIIAISTLNINTKTVVFAVVIVFGFIVFKFLDDRKFNKYYNDMKNEKNKEIERLADDNRRYRDIYLNNIGVSQETINQISAANVEGN